jgi:hypothetical protein
MIRSELNPAAIALSRDVRLVKSGQIGLLCLASFETKVKLYNQQ